MTVGIVGANGQVGTELCFLFRAAGTEVVPIVRTPLAAATFDHYGFDYRVADVVNDPQPPVEDLDVVVIAAFSPYLSRAQYRAGEAREDNERLVDRVTEHAAPGATLVYFSTLAAFGRKIGRNPLWWYGREKRRVEQLFERACSQYDKEGYVFRLGHVFGVNQDIATEIRDRLTDVHQVRVRATPSAYSNAVHAVTVREAIGHCARGDVDPGRYTVVNSPRWTWKDVIDYYADDDVSVRFAPPDESDDDGPGASRLISGASRLVSGFESAVPLSVDELLTFAQYFPEGMAKTLYEGAKRRRRPSELRAFKRRFDFHRHEFDYDPVPGPFLADLRVSRNEIATAEEDIPAVL